MTAGAPAGAPWLLDGPRGRRLCHALLERSLGPAWWAARSEEDFADHGRLVEELPSPLESMLTTLAGDEPPEARLLTAFAHAVGQARYWQEPDGIDRALAHDNVRDALAPLAHAVAARAPAWWSSPVALGDLVAVTWIDEPAVPLSLAGAARKLDAWRESTLEAEREAVSRPADVRESISARWWSSPCLSELATTTRALPGLGALRLDLVEDDMGRQIADCQRVRVDREPRVYEIAGPADWVSLVERYPLDVTRTRRYDWWRAAEVEGSWLIPDYARISEDFDAVHLTARGYLTTAGRALPAGDAWTLMAGWDPDQTYWLTDCLVPDGSPQRWVRVDRWADDVRWRRSEGGGHGD